MIELTGLCKSVREPNGHLRALFEDLDFHLKDVDHSIAILGRSGSGKSSLLRVLAGLDTTYTGNYLFNGDPLTRTSSSMANHRANHIGIIPQHYDLLYDRTARHNVRLGTPGKPAATRDAQKALELVGVGDLADVLAKRLSGGQAQRVAIARALVKEPRVVLADEPTGALDESTENDVLDLFDRLQAQGHRFVIATHSPTVAARCERRLLLQDNALTDLD